MPVLLLAIEPEQLPEGVEARVQAAAPEYEVLVTRDRDEVLRRAGEIEIVMGFPPRDLLAGMPRLAWFQQWAAGADWLRDHPEVCGLFNVGTGKARSFADLARAVFAAMQRPENISYVPTPEAIRDKYQYFTEAKMARLRTAGYDRPFTELEDGVARYVRDYLSQPDPYR